MAKKFKSYDLLVALLDNSYIHHDLPLSIGEQKARRGVELGRRITERVSTIAKQMNVERIEVHDKLIPVVERAVADSTTRIVDFIFPSELSTTPLSYGRLMQLRQNIVKLPKNEHGSSHEFDAKQVIDISNNKQTLRYILFRQRAKTGEKNRSKLRRKKLSKD